ncbi:putative terpene synthase 12 [Hibiscus syriacus]|uniref:Terpene synthase 12 n=1 Tax=Hibiscus syriacus TaxID=106335 RepID=A0A6A2Z4G3_HIBSY|nr:putative terpene synthase 12 [Hibiscus syriacus]
MIPINIRCRVVESDNRSFNGSFRIRCAVSSDTRDAIYKERAAKLEKELRFAINDEDAEPVNFLELIDDIQRLGLWHRFEMDIGGALRKFESSDDGGVAEEYSLHAAALRFRLFRQHGYEISQDVFKAFKDNKGNFKGCLHKDVKGMLSFYEASHLAFEGEDLMDEALTFSRMHLMDLRCVNNLEKGLLEEVSRTLELPLHRRMLRLEAWWYIEAYSRRATANPTLLELAKLDFNMVQSTHQEDLKKMARWWIGMGLASKLNFARDRLVECFFWWDVGAAKNLPKCMELCFLALYNSVNEMAYQTLRDHGQNNISYLTKAWTDLCKAFLKEAKWEHSKHVPTFQDYLENAWISVSGHAFLVHAYFLQNSSITGETFDSLEQYHDVLRFPSTIFRLCNDLGTSKDELERGESANSITCYMKETGCSEDEARQHISDLIDSYWKKMNRCRVDGSTFAKQLLETGINLAWISQCTYQHGDVHGCPDYLSEKRVQSFDY